MATIITSECINCGACEPECPNTAIYQGGVEWELTGVTHPPIATEIFYIVAEKCTECVGFFDHEACAAVCPVDCCIPDPKNPETEGALLERAKQLHPEGTFGGDFPSRFRKGGAAAAAPAAEAPQAVPVPTTPPPPAPTPASAATAAPKPASTPAPAQPTEPAPSTAKAAAPPPPPSAAQVAEPAPAPVKTAPVQTPPPAIVQPTAETPFNIPEIGGWEIPIECFRCHGTYAVAYKHFRSGVVLYCPSCQGSYVVTTSMHGRVSRALHQFHGRWREHFDRFQTERRKELEAFEERQRAQLEAFNESLKQASREFRPPGASRKRAWIFG